MLQALGHLRPAFSLTIPGLLMSTRQTEKAYDEHLRRMEAKRREIIAAYEAKREERAQRRRARKDPGMLPPYRWGSES